MLDLDERYDTIKSLKQGQKFIHKGEYLMKLPQYVTCYGNTANAINLKTGTLLYIDDNIIIDLETMITEEML